MTNNMSHTQVTPCDQVPERRIVVAEDNVPTLRLLVTWLRQGGYEVYPAANGEAALAAIDSVRPALVIADWQMPGISGLDVCRQVRQRDRQPYTYVLIVTAREDRTDVIEAIDAGADDYLMKPINEDSLLARVGQARVALQRFRRFAELAETDPLTGLTNRRRFHELCVREIARAARYGGTLSCLLLDIDLFKHFNDTYGHATGDAILKAVADLLRASKRECDCVCRYGGDEFCVLLPDTLESHAVAFADRIRNHVAALRVQAGERTVSVRATVGVAEWRQDLATPRQLIDLADESLLAAKRAGRDRALGYGSLSSMHALNPAAVRGFRDILTEIQAAEVMITPVVTLSQNQPLLHAAEMFARLRINSLPIVDEVGRLTGIISEKDVLNEAYSEARWDRPVSELMNLNVVSYEETTPLAVIWEFFARVTLRRVIVVKRGLPSGMISRGTLLRWLGNWGAIAHQSKPHETRNHLGQLCGHIQATASAIIREAERLRSDVRADDGDPIPRPVNAATRLQEQAQALIALSQIHYRFDPRIRVTASASPVPPIVTAGSASLAGAPRDAVLLACP
jgi:diguanylate cyclase (GGDEF)-like protein